MPDALNLFGLLAREPAAMEGEEKAEIMADKICPFGTKGKGKKRVQFQE